MFIDIITEKQNSCLASNDAGSSIPDDCLLRPVDLTGIANKNYTADNTVFAVLRLSAHIDQQAQKSASSRVYSHKQVFSYCFLYLNFNTFPGDVLLPSFEIYKLFSVSKAMPSGWWKIFGSSG